MNINQNINKLLFALKQKGELYKINSFQFYSEKVEKYCTKYQILKRRFEEVYNVRTSEFELKEKYEQDYDCYGKVELLKYFIDEYERRGSEADGK